MNDAAREILSTDLQRTKEDLAFYLGVRGRAQRLELERKVQFAEMDLEHFDRRISELHDRLSSLNESLAT